MSHVVSARAVALQRCDEFVGRTTNWLYDHLRFVPRYTSFVLCDVLANRDEFPEIEARCRYPTNLTRRIWRRLAGDHLYPGDLLKLKQLGPCVMHSHFGYTALEDFALHRALQIPWVVGFYGADVYQLGRQGEWQERYIRLFDAAAQVLALGPVMKVYLERMGCPAEKVRVHRLGIDLQGLPNMPRVLKPGEPLRVLFAGTFREKKGLPYLIEAVALAKRAGVQLELCLVGDATLKPGDRETKDLVFRKISEFGLEDVVTHHSYLPFRELMSHALRYHVFVAPSITALDGDAEGTPFVLQQMMATGMPAIATYHSDIPYLFGDHADLLVPERDAVAIARRLELYADDSDALLTDGESLRSRISSAFDVRECAVRLSNLYDEVQCR
jgi:colanic acid/amylovoran biosynthesis glycosyltransferase